MSLHRDIPYIFYLMMWLSVILASRSVAYFLFFFFFFFFFSCFDEQIHFLGGVLFEDFLFLLLRMQGEYSNGIIIFQVERSFNVIPNTTPTHSFWKSKTEPRLSWYIISDVRGLVSLSSSFDRLPLRNRWEER